MSIARANLASYPKPINERNREQIDGPKIDKHQILRIEQLTKFHFRKERWGKADMVFNPRFLSLEKRNKDGSYSHPRTAPFF